MDFARSHTHHESVATKSKIRHIAEQTTDGRRRSEPSLDDMLISAANQAAADLFPEARGDPSKVDSSLYPDRMMPQSERIQENDLVVIFESFDNLRFCYAKAGEIFSNRNGHFHHNDFIGKSYGCKVRSRDNRGYGYMYLLKPTPELWARSLNHRTQIVHELDASMIVYYLNLRPNMHVCESGTGSGALSHCILRAIAPKGHLDTYEFNEARAVAARKEFEKNRVNHLVTVHHKDVCGTNEENTMGGFDRPQASVDAVSLDLPQPWLAVPHAAYVLKPNSRLVSYSPCVEQSQKTIVALKEAGFHSIKTMEFRLREHYVDEVELEVAPREKRPRMPGNPFLSDRDTGSGGEDTGAEADNEKSEYETEDQASLTGINSQEELDSEVVNTGQAPIVLPVPPTTGGEKGVVVPKKRKALIARPFGLMRGHTAFLTFATAGNTKQPNPNNAQGTK